MKAGWIIVCGLACAPSSAMARGGGAVDDALDAVSDAIDEARDANKECRRLVIDELRDAKEALRALRDRPSRERARRVQRILRDNVGEAEDNCPRGVAKR